MSAERIAQLEQQLYNLTLELNELKRAQVNDTATGDGVPDAAAGTLVRDYTFATLD
ncbi:MAG: hypothetical protein AAGI15_00730 [Pseudomonadota bacterium]